MHYISNFYHNQAVQHYLADIPKNTKKQMLYSFGVTTVLNTVIKCDLKSGLIIGAFAATASAVHSLITPFFINYIGMHRPLTMEEEIIRSSSALIVSAYIATNFGIYSLMQNLFNLAVIFTALAYLIPNRRDTDKASYFIV